MRSFTSSQATDMDQCLWFSLLLTHLLVAEGGGTEAKDCPEQPDVIWKKKGDTAELLCNINPYCLGASMNFSYTWFVFKEDKHSRLDLSKNPNKYKLSGAYLHIKSFNANDTGIYHCGAFQHGQPDRGQQHVGKGITLALKGHDLISTKYITLWLAFVLLVFYSMVVVALIVLKKRGYNMNFCREMDKLKKNQPSKKIQFRNVIEEMHKKRNLEKQKHSRFEASTTDFNNTSDDIYQNV